MVPAQQRHNEQAIEPGRPRDDTSCPAQLFNSGQLLDRVGHVAGGSMHLAGNSARVGVRLGARVGIRIGTRVWVGFGARAALLCFFAAPYQGTFRKAGKVL